MDPYFKPILISAGLILLLNTIFVLPFNGAPLFSYVFGGIVAVILYKKDRQKKLEDNSDASGDIEELKFEGVKTFDSIILGLGTGVVAGSILSLIFAIKLQDPQLKQQLLDIINRSIEMHSASSQSEISRLDDLSPVFMVITTMITVGLCSFSTLFGSVLTLPFINKKRK